ncbi:MAG: glycosyltransferase [Cyanobacteria bacterium DS2.3.42]|nr:glycosyltransferase [Cyanobacteria bacterium DS2.3.42]
MTTKCSQLSLVIPVYNSADQISLVVSRAVAVLEKIVERFEIILVNDASKDESWLVIANLARQDSRLRAINLGRNAGQHNALLCGIRLARFSTCVTMDDDLQFVPEDIPQLIEKLDQGFDVVYGSPERQQHGFLRNAASQLTKLTLKRLLGGEIATYISPFRAFRTKLRDAFKDAQGQFTLIDVLLSWGTSRFAYVFVNHSERQFGASNYTFSKLVLCALNLITGFTTIPLRIAVFNGILCILLGIVLLLYVFICYFRNGGSVPGFPFLASVIIIFSGAQLFALGIIGEYLGRMYERSLSIPSYFIESLVENVADKEAGASTEISIDCSVPVDMLKSGDAKTVVGVHGTTAETAS